MIIKRKKEQLGATGKKISQGIRVIIASTVIFSCSLLLFYLLSCLSMEAYASASGPRNGATKAVPTDKVLVDTSSNNAPKGNSQISAENPTRALQVPDATKTTINQLQGIVIQNQRNEWAQRQWQNNYEAGINRAFNNLLEKQQENQWIARNNGRANGSGQQVPTTAISGITPPALVKVNPAAFKPYIANAKPIRIATTIDRSTMPEIPKPPETLASVTFPKLNNTTVPVRITTQPLATALSKPTMPTSVAASKPGNIYATQPTTYKSQVYKLPALANNNTFKPITPVFIQPYKLTALSSGLPNTFTTLKPIKLEFVKISSITPIKMPFNQTNPAFNKTLKPVFLPIKNPITLPISQPTLIKPQWAKLDNSFNQAMRPVLPKITAISPIKQLAPLKPTLNTLTPIKPMQLPFDAKLTKAPTPILMPLPKFESFGYNALTKPNFTMIKQPEPIKPMAIEKNNLYIIKEAGMLSQIKPKFESFAPTLAAKPQWIKLVEVNSAIKPEFTKIGQATPTLTQQALIKPEWIKISNANPAIKFEFTKINQATPTLTQLVPLKPQWATIGTIKPLDMHVDANLTKIPQLASTMPKFVSVDFNAVKAPEFIKLNQTGAAKVALTQLSPALNNNLKPVFMPIKNQTIAVTQIVPIKP
ncbi:MAG: hypothetical protein WCY05_02955, partial [Candidatus Omnitrophota bacterium]